MTDDTKVIKLSELRRYQPARARATSRLQAESECQKRMAEVVRYIQGEHPSAVILEPVEVKDRVISKATFIEVTQRIQVPADAFPDAQIDETPV